jgi:hypothetical protein
MVRTPKPSKTAHSPLKVDGSGTGSSPKTMPARPSRKSGVENNLSWGIQPSGGKFTDRSYFLEIFSRSTFNSLLALSFASLF